MMRQVLVTSDDCGLSEGINLATVDLHQRGLVHNASLMTNFPAFSHAIALFKQYPALNVGIHLNLTDGFATIGIAKNSGLTNSDGHFRTIQSVVNNTLIPNQAFLSAVKAELTAQIDAGIRAGIKPQHLTTHLHFHTIPALRNIIFSLAKHYDVQWVRAYKLRATVLPFNTLLAKPMHPKHEMTLDYLAPLMYWLTHDRQQLKTMLDRLTGTIELVIHPCTKDDPTFPTGVKYQPHQRFKEVESLIQLFSIFNEIIQRGK